MGLVPGHLAHFYTSDTRPYAVGVYRLAHIIQDSLIHAFFYERCLSQMENGQLKGLDHEQVRFASIAHFNIAIINLAKLIEDDKKTWNFRQLHKEWSKFANDATKQKEALAAIVNLHDDPKLLKKYRDQTAAHQTKAEAISNLHVLPDKVPSITKVVQVMDMFVAGKIPYKLFLLESNEELDLRDLLQLPAV